MTTATKAMQCCSQVNQGMWCQESYETASRDAGRRVRQLKKAGYRVFSSAMGSQVTPLGVIKLTMVDIRPGDHEDTFYMPKENWEMVGWPRY